MKRTRANMSQGFTLVEVIVTIGIVFVLGALSLPIASRVTALREDVHCLSNLRQIGLGIVAYANDRDGRLPGPLISGQYPYWSHYSQLSWYLEDYLELDKTIEKSGRRDVFVCPAYMRVAKKGGDFQVYGMNIQVLMEGEAGIRQPFGYANLSDPRTFGDSYDYPPMRIADISRIRDSQGRPAATTTWAMRDVDMNDGRFEGMFLSPNPLLPQRPVHGRHRNALFFDFHVERMKAE